jgi:hypothetical protein
MVTSVISVLGVLILAIVASAFINALISLKEIDDIG